MKQRDVKLCVYSKQRIESKRIIGKHSTADLYQAASHHFYRFLGNRDISIRKITPAMLTDFQAYLHAKGLKINSINSYLSSLRAIYNAAFEEYPFLRLQHPFRKLKLKRDRTVKKPLSEQQLRQLATAQFPNRSDLMLATDIALFSFMAYGMPFVDMVHLTRKNIHGETIVYNRHKTGIEIRIEMTVGMRQLIHKYAREDSLYLFPLCTPPNTHRQYKQLLSRYNQALKEVGQRLHLSDNLTSYAMRYTWAAEARRKHIDIAVISQALGHTSEKTTRSYFNRLDQQELNQANLRITYAVCRWMKGHKKRGKEELLV